MKGVPLSPSPNPFLSAFEVAPMLRLSLAFAAVLSTSSLASAQTTHNVDLFSLSFSDPALTIAVGDTVQWTWLNGMHNVESGVGGIHDGIFRSGAPTFPPMIFSVTFDQAFLDANPVPGKVYNYYCAVHVGFGMTGSVTVDVPSAMASRNGGVNPASLATAGSPIIGTNLVVTVDLTTTGHDFALLFGFDSPFNFTLGGGQTLLCLDLLGSGELLGQVTQPGPVALYSLPVPNDTSLCGFEFCMQAIHFGGIVPFALSDAVDATIGNS